MNSPIFVLPARKAPETMFKIAACRCQLALRLAMKNRTTESAHFLPQRSATVGNKSVPRTPPAWKRPFMVEMRPVPLDRVSRAK